MRAHILASSLCMALAGAGSVLAAESDEWRYEFTPYLLGAGLDGKVGVRGVTADVDASFDDILDNLDQAFMALFTASRGPWTYGLEAVYFKLEDEGASTVTGPFGQVSVSGALEVTSSLYVYQGSVGYRIVEGPTDIDLVGALRYTEIDVDADVAIATVPGIIFPGGSTSAGGSEGWVDAVIGVRALHPVSEQVSLLGYADAGGGGSDLTYQLMLGANWAFSDRFSAKLGYRLLDWDYDHDGTVWDIQASGPYLGLGIQF